VKQNLIIAVLAVALVGSWAWFLTRGQGAAQSGPADAQTAGAPVALRTAAPPPGADNELATLEKVAPGSRDYARAQRLIGYNIYGAQRGDWKQAKEHVDLALKASPNDPKVLEDAGRVYLKVGLTAEGQDMLKRANTPAAQRALSEQMGT
jgi:tetratricopeptide (TPR) repeat protein